MRAGEFPDGARVLRAKIDMAAPNIVLRDPTLYRIKRATHHRTGDAWCIYPMYDFAHCLSDAIEGITHSICTLEFEINRPLYDWVLDNVDAPARPRQYEFARLNLTYTVISKRKLLRLVQGGTVSGWDDPRMPTLSGLRRRGYTPEAIRAFCDKIGVGKRDSTVDVALLEHCLREDLNRRAPRLMAVLRPLKLVIENYPEGQRRGARRREQPRGPGGRQRARSPSRASSGSTATTSARTRPKGFLRLAPGREVRLRYAYFVKCVGVVKDAAGEIVEVRCTYDPATRGGDAPDGRKVKVTMHWVSAARAREAEVRLYDRLFALENPDEAGGLPRGAQPELARDPAAGAGSSPRSRDVAPGRHRPVRARRLLRRRRARLPPGRPGLQPRRDPARRLGEAAEEVPLTAPDARA